VNTLLVYFSGKCSNAPAVRRDRARPALIVRQGDAFQAPSRRRAPSLVVGFSAGLPLHVREELHRRDHTTSHCRRNFIGIIRPKPGLCSRYHTPNHSISDGADDVVFGKRVVQNDIPFMRTGINWGVSEDAHRAAQRRRRCRAIACGPYPRRYFDPACPWPPHLPAVSQPRQGVHRCGPDRRFVRCFIRLNVPAAVRVTWPPDTTQDQSGGVLCPIPSWRSAESGH
jgi:hypothetical protein